MRENKGITLISLVITIIVIIIIASITVTSGISSIKSSKYNKFEQELLIMQAQVDLLYEKYYGDNAENVRVPIVGKSIDSDDSDLFEEKYGANKKKEIEDNVEPNLKNYEYFDKETLEKLEIDGLENEFLVNIKKRKVISINGFIMNDKVYYTLDEMNANYKVEGNIESGNIEFQLNTNKGANNQNYKISVEIKSFSKYVAKGKVQYKKDGETNWRTAETYAKIDDVVDFEVNNPGRYVVKVTDEKDESKEEEFSIWGYVTDENGRKSKVTDGVITLELGDMIDYDPVNYNPKEDQNNVYVSTQDKNGYGDQTFVLKGQNDNDAVSYDTERFGWKVLGVDESGKLLLVSEGLVLPTVSNATVNNVKYFQILGRSGYEKRC